MTLPRLLCTTLVLGACTPPEKSLGKGDDGTGTTGGDESPASGDVSGPDDGATSMTPADDGASTGGECAGVPIPPCDPGACDPGCGVTSLCVDGGWTCTCECSDTGESSGGEEDSGDTGAVACEIAQAACEIAEQSEAPAIDCGDVTLDDPEATWIAAHDCALAALAATESFKLVYDVQGIDSFPRTALLGMAGFAYQRIQLNQDFGGLVPGPHLLSYRECDAIVATPDCTTTVGEMCLQCDGRLDGEVYCEP